MKTIKLLTVLVLTIAMASCGGSKKAAEVYPTKETSPTRVKIEKEECEEEAMKAKEYLRGYGIGNSQDKMFARDIASTNARNEIATQVKSSVANTLKRYNQQHVTAGKNGLTRDETSKIEAAVASITEETLTGTRVICSNTYMVETNYEVHVCIELTGEDFAESIYNTINDDQKLRIDYDAEKFKEEFNNDLEEYRKRKRGE
ncbi:hypothetical protein OAA06_00800 [bacterium]|nr:hypothetical protein [bacterium]